MDAGTRVPAAESCSEWQSRGKDKCKRRSPSGNDSKSGVTNAEPSTCSKSLWGLRLLLVSGQRVCTAWQREVDDQGSEQERGQGENASFRANCAT